MEYQKYKNIITCFNPDNVWCDEYGDVEYQAFPRMLEELNASFEGYRKEGISCLGLFMPNSVLQAIVVLYLLSENINFFIASGNSNGSPQFPSFCDKILTVAPRTSRERSLTDQINWSPNPGYVKNKCTPPPNSGLAYFSSSGTSGAAKYICFKAANLIRNAKKCIDRFSVYSGSRLLITVPVSHMYGMGVGLLPALIMGANACLIEKNNVIKFFRYVAEFNPDIVLITPMLAKMILTLNKDIPRRRIYISAGERIDPRTYRDFESRYGLLVNLYGCTELGAIGTSPLDEANATSRLMGVIHPLPDVSVLINEGPHSEICVCHDAGFEGYAGQNGEIQPPELSDQAYYRTKDAGRSHQNDGFVISGRIDNCVNRSGFLLSLDEVESKLKTLFDGFGQIVVFEEADTGRILPRLIAVCETAGDTGVGDMFVKDICRRHMSRYAVPDEFIYVQTIPKLHNGKVDRIFVKNNYNSLKQ